MNKHTKQLAQYHIRRAIVALRLTNEAEVAFLIHDLEEVDENLSEVKTHNSPHPERTA